MNDLHDLELLLGSHTPILVIESLEEPRVLQICVQLGLRLGKPVFRWTFTEGLSRADTHQPGQRTTADPAEVLRHIKATSLAGLYLLLDFHPFLDNPLHMRLIKEIAQTYGETPRTLVLVSHALAVPPEVRHLSARFTLRLPDRARLLGLIREEAEQWQRQYPGQSVRADRTAVEQLAGNLLGVTESDARRLMRNAIHRDGAITHEDVQEVMKAKYELLSSEGAISFEYDTAHLGDVAGLDNLKAWLERRRQVFLGATATAERPRGILLLGVQGCGKSLAAKATAGRFGVPLLRLDFGSLYDKYYGETEKNLRRSLQIAEVMAPCVLWLDEIEKGLATGSGDEGVSERVLGTFLTWLSEHKRPIFVVATANNIERLPPELIRKGRLDEIFFVDLPDHDSRRCLFEIQLRRRNLAPSGFDLDALAQASAGFSGAEIEAVVVSALYAAQTHNADPSTADLALEIERTQPLSVVMAEKVAALREWAQNRTVPAHPPSPPIGGDLASA
jgi:SpoVK/Ycf46/Vps4 family AAA+-type ATPase